MMSSEVGHRRRRRVTPLSGSQNHRLVTLVLLISYGFHWSRNVNASPDMFTSLVDVQRALSDELSATDLIRDYISSERQRIDKLQQ